MACPCEKKEKLLFPWEICVPIPPTLPGVPQPPPTRSIRVELTNTTAVRTKGTQVAPPGVTTMQITLYGAGGGGANALIDPTGNHGGGGGGGIAIMSPVLPAEDFKWEIGGIGVGGKFISLGEITAATPGGDTTVIRRGLVTTATGGGEGTSSPGLGGGGFGANIVQRAVGGRGGQGFFSGFGNTGGGGGGAGGTDGTPFMGGEGRLGGGNGGNPRPTSSGEDGGFPGGGGAGGSGAAGNGPGTNGGNGGGGRIVILYT